MPTSPATVVLGLSASAFWGSGDFCGGIASRRLGAMQMVAIAHGFSLILFLALGLAFHEAILTGHVLLIALASGLAGCIGLVCLYRALTIGHMGLSASLSGLLTAGIPVAWSLVHTGAPAPIQSIGFILAAIAICLIALAPASKHTSESAAPGPSSSGIQAFARRTGAQTEVERIGRHQVLAAEGLNEGLGLVGQPGFRSGGVDERTNTV